LQQVWGFLDFHVVLGVDLMPEQVCR
jgi:hypothetical protein